MRIERLVATGDWWDGTLPLLDAPQGLAMHWTRPFDVIVLALALPLLPFMAMKGALFWAGALASPLLEAVGAALLAWAGRAWLGRSGSLLAVLVFLAQPAVYAVYQVGRIDHHSLHLTLALAVIGLLLVWSLRRERLWMPVAAGAAAACGLWVGAEALLTIAVAGGALGLAWLRRERASAPALGRFAAGLAGGTLIALVIERPPSQWLAVELDRLSLVHVVLVAGLGVAAAIVVLADRRRPDLAPAWRLAVALVAGALAVLPMALWFPDFFAGPYGEINDEVQKVFLANVQEAEPMLARGGATLSSAVFALGALVLALPYAVVGALQGPVPRRIGWLLLAVAMTLYVAATLHEMRVLPYAQAAFVLPWVAAALAAGRWALDRLERPWRVPAAALAAGLALLAPTLVAAALVDAGARRLAEARVDHCDWPALADYLARSHPADGTIATYVFPGPLIAWTSGYGVISAPYHRNADGILDVHGMFLAPPDVARAIARRRDLGLVVLCPQAPGRGGHNWYLKLSGPDGLYGRLAAGAPPDWLVPLADGDPRLAGFQVSRSSLRADPFQPGSS